MFRPLAAACLLLIAPVAEAATLLAYDSVNGATRAPAFEATGVDGADLTRGFGINQAGGLLFNSNNFLGPENAADAVLAGHFFTWGFTSASAFNLDTLGLSYDASSTGPSRLIVELNVNNLGFAEVFSDDAIATDNETNAGIDLSSFDMVSSAVFRLSAFSAQLNIGTFSFVDDPALSTDGDFAIVVNGAVAAVPAPETLALLLSGLGVFALYRRKSLQA